jgi:hypothetical protein
MQDVAILGILDSIIFLGRLFRTEYALKMLLKHQDLANCLKKVHEYGNQFLKEYTTSRSFYNAESRSPVAVPSPWQVKSSDIRQSKIIT